MPPRQQRTIAGFSLLEGWVKIHALFGTVYIGLVIAACVMLLASAILMRSFGFTTPIWLLVLVILVGWIVVTVSVVRGLGIAEEKGHKFLIFLFAAIGILTPLVVAGALPFFMRHKH